MANFEVLIEQVQDVQEHPDADRLTLVKIRGFTCIANKKPDGSWRYAPGDLVVYIPEGAIVPEWLLKKMDMWDEEKGKGILAGSAGNRVKAIRLRGIFSQGILYPAQRITGKLQAFVEKHQFEKFDVGEDVSEYLGIKKYVPEVPKSMDGIAVPCPGKTLKFDVENIQKYICIIAKNDPVYISEKLHGTFCCLAYWPFNNPEVGDFYAFSKGLGEKGLVFPSNEENSEKNVYVRALNRFLTQEIREKIVADGKPIFFLGELYGKGIQDLSYGQEEPHFRVFDVFTDGEYKNPDEVEKLAHQHDLEVVPHLYYGPWDEELAEKLRDGKDTISESHVREGVVVRPAEVRYHDKIGRVILKMVSPDYLLRKGGTEFN